MLATRYFVNQYMVNSSPREENNGDCFSLATQKKSPRAATVQSPEPIAASISARVSSGANCWMKWYAYERR